MLPDTRDELIELLRAGKHRQRPDYKAARGGYCYTEFIDFTTPDGERYHAEYLPPICRHPSSPARWGIFFGPSFPRIGWAHGPILTIPHLDVFPHVTVQA